MLQVHDDTNEQRGIHKPQNTMIQQE